VALVATFISVTFAPGTPLPCWSVTIPLMAEVPVWLRKTDAKNSRQTNTAKLAMRSDRFIDCSSPAPESKIE
jgi:hypothetical protein